MIDFIELEPFISDGAFSPTTQTLIPVHMIKDGAEYFVSNLPIAGGNYSPEYHRQELEAYKAQLLKTEGRYFKFYGFYDEPEAMIAEILKRGHTFTKPRDIFLESPSGAYGAGFIDFLGNCNEVSAAFHYRIFDKGYAEKLKDLVNPIIERKGRKRR